MKMKIRALANKLSSKKSAKEEDLYKLFEAVTALSFETRGHKKMWAYVQHVMNLKEVQDEVMRLREKYGLPRGGFKTRQKKFLIDQVYKIKLPFPRAEFRNIDASFEVICEKYSLHYMDWYEMFEVYFLFNILEKPEHNTNSASICLLHDVPEEKAMNKEGSGKFEESDDITYPIAIRVSPYASQQDILDYVRKMMYLIEMLQKKYKKQGVMIGRVRQKITRSRNQIIMAKKKLPRKVIASYIEKKTGQKIKEENIRNIISREKKKEV